MMKSPIKVGIAIAIVGAAVLALAALASGDTGKVQRVFVPVRSEPPPGVPEPPDLSVPAGDPTVLSDPLGAEAASLGEPAKFVVSNEKVAPIDREAIWVFDDATIGEFPVIESVAFETQSELEEPAAHEPGCTIEYATDNDGYTLHCSTGGGELQKLDNGTIALAIDGARTHGSLKGPVLRTLTWIEPLRDVSPNLLERHPADAVLEVKLYTLSDGATIADLVTMANKM